MYDLPKLIGEQLRMFRKSKKSLSQEKLAEMIGEKMSKSRISDIENGKINISLKTLGDIMNALDITPNELFNFQKLEGVQGINDKMMMLDIQKHLLMERGIEEIKYVLRTTRDFLDTVDAKNDTGSNKRYRANSNLNKDDK